jgi:hypothetical protein
MKLRIFYISIATAGLLAVGILAMFLTRIQARTDTNKITLPSIEDVPGEYWAKLAGKKIFFGHQSVGYNIVDGIKDIISERDYIKLNIVEKRESAAFDRPVFTHSQVGMNSNHSRKSDTLRK